MARNANSGQISINHLSPIRIENNFKDIEHVNILVNNIQTNNERCKNKFKSIEVDIEQDLDKVNHQTFKVNDQKQLQAVLLNNEDRFVQIIRKGMNKIGSSGSI